MSDQLQIPGTEPPRPRRPSNGPVYTGVTKSIRRLTAAVDGQPALIDAEVWAGTIAQARSLAASIDNVDGRNPLTQANGVPLSAMHEKLDLLMARLNPDAADGQGDVMVTLMQAMEREEARQRERTGTAPHPEV